MFKDINTKFAPVSASELNSDDLNMENYSIVACLSRINTNNKSIPNTFKDEGVTVVASSTIVKSESLDIEKLNDNINKYSKFGKLKKYIIVSVGLQQKPAYDYLDNVLIFYINFYNLIRLLKSGYDPDDYPKPKEDKIDIYYKNKIIIQIMQYMNRGFKIYDIFPKEKLLNEYEVVFYIQHMTWDSFVYILNSTGISVFGGFSQKRHILSTVQSNLTTFLNLCYGYSYLNDIVYHGNLKSNEFIKLKKDLDKKIKNNKLNNINNEDFLLKLLQYFWGGRFDNLNLPVWVNNFIFIHYSEIIKIISKLEMIRLKIKVSVKQGNEILVKLSNKSPDEIKKEKDLILNLEKIVLNLKSLKLNYNTNFKTLMKLNRIGILEFKEGVCVDFPLIKENLDESLTLISEEEFYTRYGQYLSYFKSKLDNLKKILKPKTKPLLKVVQSKREFSTSSSLNRGSSKNLLDPIALIKDKGPYLDYISEEIQLAELDPKSAQINLENQWLYKVLNTINEVEDIDNNVNTDNKINKNKSNLQFKQNKIFKKAFETLELKSNFIKRKIPNIHPYLKPAHVVLTYGLMDVYCNYKSFTEVLYKVAEGILREIYFSEVKKKKDKNFDFKTFSLNLNITKYDQFKLGLIFINIFLEKPTPLYIRGYRSGIDLEDSEISDDNLAILVKNVDFLDENSTKKIIPPYSLPMLAEPLPWSNIEFGGYYFNAQYKEDIITGQTHSHKVGSREILYNSINRLNKIKFKINSNLLLFLLGDGLEILKYYFNNLKNKSDLLHNITTLKLAKIYNLLKTPFYIPTHADWRGRLYTVSYYLTYQGNELSLALLNLFEGQPMTQEGLVYLNIYGANNYNEKGISKQSINSKLEWVKLNYNKIINLDIEFILKAESPILFTAFCLALREYHLNPKANIHLPVFLDATCSGIQHLSALILDAEAGKYVNLIAQNNNSNVNDIYSEMLNPINNSLRKLGKSDVKYKKFESINLLRANIKTSIMTQVYNVTLTGIKEQILNSLKKIKIEVPIENNSELNYNNNVIDKNIIKVKELNQIADLNLLPQIDVKPEINTESEISLTDSITLDSQIKGSKKGKGKFKDKVRTRTYYEYLVPSIDGGQIRLKEYEVYKIAQIIDNEIFIKFPSLQKIFDYLIEVAKLCVNCNVPLNWFTPAGVEITQVYNKSNKVKASITLGQKSKSIHYREMTDSLDKRKQSQAIIPNIVHSLDSAHLMLILEKADYLNIKDILTIHDCFGSHPNDMEALKKLVISEFVRIYSDYDFLTKFHNRIKQSIEDNGLKIEMNEEGAYYVIPKRSKKYFLPSLPIKGHLNLELALQSKNLIV